MTTRLHRPGLRVHMTVAATATATALALAGCGADPLLPLRPPDGRRDGRPGARSADRRLDGLHLRRPRPRRGEPARPARVRCDRTRGHAGRVPVLPRPDPKQRPMRRPRTSPRQDPRRGRRPEARRRRQGPADGPAQRPRRGPDPAGAGRSERRRRDRAVHRRRAATSSVPSATAREHSSALGRQPAAGRGVRQASPASAYGRSRPRDGPGALIPCRSSSRHRGGRDGRRTAARLPTTRIDVALQLVAQPPDLIEHLAQCGRVHGADGPGCGVELCEHVAAPLRDRDARRRHGRSALPAAALRALPRLGVPRRETRPARSSTPPWPSPTPTARAATTARTAVHRRGRDPPDPTASSASS